MDTKQLHPVHVPPNSLALHPQSTCRVHQYETQCSFMSKPTSQHGNPPHADGGGAGSSPLYASCGKPPGQLPAPDIVQAKVQPGQGGVTATSTPLPVETNHRLPADIPAPSLTFESESTTRPDTPLHTPRLGGKQDESVQGDFLGRDDWLQNLTPLHRHILLLQTTVRMDQLRASYLEARYCINLYTQAHIVSRRSESRTCAYCRAIASSRGSWRRHPARTLIGSLG
jgi:hypothetical protein